jgi:chemotaxis protein methyltransferase CheR
MKPDDFAFFTKYIYDQSGIVLGADKMYLIESRLAPVARKFNLTSIDALVGQLRSARDPNMQRDIVDAMTTNESFFFRDGKPFDQFKTLVLPQLLANRAAKKSFRIWCAAASTGQEPYTIAMILKEAGHLLAGWRYEIVGTDLSTEALDRAKNGIYTQFEVQRGLPIQLLVKYFKQQGDKWQIAPEIRAMVQYKNYNLLHDFGALGGFDVVFCRNVLIYFDQKTKGSILDRIAKLMPADGLLYLGGAETVLGVTDKFQPMAGQRGIYQLTSAKPS